MTAPLRPPPNDTDQDVVRPSCDGLLLLARGAGFAAFRDLRVSASKKAQLTKRKLSRACDVSQRGDAYGRNAHDAMCVKRVMHVRDACA